jgi:hypothetical protein
MNLTVKLPPRENASRNWTRSCSTATTLPWCVLHFSRTDLRVPATACHTCPSHGTTCAYSEHMSHGFAVITCALPTRSWFRAALRRAEPSHHIAHSAPNEAVLSTFQAEAMSRQISAARGGTFGPTAALRQFIIASLKPVRHGSLLHMRDLSPRGPWPAPGQRTSREVTEKCRTEG